MPRAEPPHADEPTLAFIASIPESESAPGLMGSLERRARALLEAFGVGVMVATDSGALRFLAATQAVLLDLERQQLELDEGPCLDAYRKGVTVLAPDLVAEERWPAFTGQAVARGLRSVASFPMISRGVVLGAFNAYWSTPHTPSPQSVAHGELLARVATVALVAMDRAERAAGERRDLQAALDARVVTEQAIGMLSMLLACDADHARGLLEDRAIAEGVAPAEVARRVVEGSVAPEALLPPE